MLIEWHWLNVLLKLVCFHFYFIFISYTGVHHQIRAHLGFGIDCPILGDHKYSHYTDFKPQVCAFSKHTIVCILLQRLLSQTLERLGIRNAKSRRIPMHLHASMVCLQDFCRFYFSFSDTNS
jgi:23S rRNA-/tRNA-specific pseudouridylate synthase